jgi:hypothetical protein
MTLPAIYSFVRYLAAKRTVDDRALNAHVWASLRQALAAFPVAQHPISILEIGAGIGTMAERLLEANFLPPASYALLDAEAENLAVARQRLAHWTTAHAAEITSARYPSPFTIQPTGAFGLAPTAANELTVHIYPLDLFRFLATQPPDPCIDLLIAHAFIDLVDVSSTLAQLTPLLRPGALVYLTINFDGVTLLQPELDPPLDALIEHLYHATMDNRIVDGKPSGDSRTGRHLFHQLEKAGIQVLDAGSSDWVVIPHDDLYPADEAYFLHFIVHTIQGALGNAPELDTARFAAWIAERHAQIERGELVYIAHQLDYLGRFAG